MKRAGRLLEQIATLENVAAAYWLAAKGRRRSEGARSFAMDPDRQINRLVIELADGTWHPGPYHMFQVRDPKLRVIHAAPFRDRVAHHALMRVCGPHLERGAMPYSFACRTGRGSHAAVRHAAGRARVRRFFLKLDIRKYFDSVEHDRLDGLLRCVIKDGSVLDLMGKVIRSYETQPGRGLPIGTLTSQYLANFYLDGLDRWIIEDLGGRDYARYMDDFVLWHDEPGVLEERGRRIRDWLLAERGLTLKHEPDPRPCREGMEFLGYRVLPEGILIARRGRRRFAAKLTACGKAHQAGTLSGGDFQRRLDALLAWVRVANCRGWLARTCARIAATQEPA
ncbi:MAG: reverse transcriptase/maturase family protein [Verrucomicrobiales bacterium]